MARALVAFLDFSISIARRTDGLRVIIHDYVSEFSVGVPQPLLEHPVTKRQDQSVIVNEEDGKLVCSISESGGFGSGSVNSVGDGSVNSGSVGVNEVVILEMLDSSSRIKQTLKYSHVTCHRWYVRDPNATNVAAIDVNGNADAAAAAAATTAATAEAEINAPNDSQNNNNNAVNDNIVDGKDTKASDVDDNHVARESDDVEAGGGGRGRDVAVERKEEETAVKKKADRKNRKAKSRSRKTKGEEIEENGKGEEEEEVGEEVKETAEKVTGLCTEENNNETGTENNNNDNQNNNQIEDEEDNNDNKPKKKGRRSGDRKFQCLLSLALY